MEAAEIPPERPIEADPAAEDADSASVAADSGVGSDTATTYTESMRSEFLESLSENGRGYHRYRDGLYLYPEDEREQERLDMQHALFLRQFGNRLYLAPTETPIRDALDLGTGTGIWAIDFADEYPDASVVGVDLSPIQPSWIPPNCKFEMDDYDADWTFDRTFDLVHGRMLMSSSASFPRLIAQALEFLKPGGWLEFQDVIMPLGCDDGTMRGTALQEWNDKFLSICETLNRSPNGAAMYKEWMKSAGFVNVEERTFKWPINGWPKDPELKFIGRWNQVNFSDGLHGFTARPFSNVLGMSMEEIEVLLAGVRNDISDRKIHVYWPMYVVYGQKPEEAPPVP